MKKIYVILALILIVAVIIIFPVQIPEEIPMPEYQKAVMNLDESYPEHPKTIQDCENTSKRDFCIGDVAEISHNIQLCYDLKDPDIKVFCIARISLDENMCKNITDEDLEEACLESIYLKKVWSSTGYEEVLSPECMVEHGEGKCFEGYFRIPFYNPSKQNISRIKINIPLGIETNITLPADFAVNETLHPEETGILTLFPCEEDIDMSGFQIEWCCGEKCYRSYINETKTSKAA